MTFPMSVAAAVGTMVGRIVLVPVRVRLGRPIAAIVVPVTAAVVTTSASTARTARTAGSVAA